MKKKIVGRVPLEESVTYFRSLVDAKGILQHAKFSRPDKRFGYSIDDNSRALILVTKLYKKTGDFQFLDLARTFLSFIERQQLASGDFLNYFQNLEKKDNEIAVDGFGQTIWAIGNSLSRTKDRRLLERFYRVWKKSEPMILEGDSLRKKAYCLLGLVEYSKLDFSYSKESIKKLSQELLDSFKNARLADWVWFEGALTYANAIIPYSLFKSGLLLKSKKQVEVAKKTLDFLLDKSRVDKVPSPIGQGGWYFRGRERSMFDQQPIEVGYNVLACLQAYKATKNSRYKKEAAMWFDWFYSKNLFSLSMIDEISGGCYDGLRPGFVNKNMGAESIICYLLAYMALNYGDF